MKIIQNLEVQKSSNVEGSQVNELKTEQNIKIEEEIIPIVEAVQVNTKEIIEDTNIHTKEEVSPTVEASQIKTEETVIKDEIIEDQAPTISDQNEPEMDTKLSAKNNHEDNVIDAIVETARTQDASLESIVKATSAAKEEAKQESITEEVIDEPEISVDTINTRKDENIGNFIIKNS